MELLSICISTRQLLNCFNQILGPWSFIYWQVSDFVCFCSSVSVYIIYMYICILSLKMQNIVLYSVGERYVDVCVCVRCVWCVSKTINFFYRLWVSIVFCTVLKRWMYLLLGWKIVYEIKREGWCCWVWACIGWTRFVAFSLYRYCDDGYCDDGRFRWFVFRGLASLHTDVVQCCYIAVVCVVNEQSSG